MKATIFKLQEVINPNTGEVSQRISVVFDNGEVIRLYARDGVDAAVATIKANRELAINSVRVVRDGLFGAYCVLSNAKDLEEF